MLADFCPSPLGPVLRPPLLWPLLRNWFFVTPFKLQQNVGSVAFRERVWLFLQEMGDPREAAAAT